MIFRVTYQSMTAFYGPSFIEAEDEYQAKRKFARGAFSQGEMALIKARPVSADEMRRALSHAED
jgi:hypothetical protein